MYFTCSVKPYANVLDYRRQYSPHCGKRQTYVPLSLCFLCRHEPYGDRGLLVIQISINGDNTFDSGSDYVCQDEATLNRKLWGIGVRSFLFCVFFMTHAFSKLLNRFRDSRTFAYDHCDFSLSLESRYPTTPSPRVWCDSWHLLFTCTAPIVV